MNPHKTEMLYGVHPVFEALRAGRRNIMRVYLSGEKTTGRLGELVQRADASNIPVEKIEAARLESMTGSALHQGVGARAGPFPLTEASTLVRDAKSSGGDPFLLLLDNVIDPHNLGALVRTALCVGVDAVLTPKDRSASPTPAVSKASAGALEHIRLARVTNMANTIKALKKKGLWIAGLDIDSDRSVYDSDLTGPIALVVGGEEKGIRPLVRKHCDFLLSIPQTGQIDSLNASVAGAVVMYEVFRQRYKGVRRAT